MAVRGSWSAGDDLPATQDTTTAATAITGWSDYTEYGTPRDPTATTTVGGDRGYGWLGAKQRSTTDTFSNGLTLMGDRLYNPTTGRFTSTDPEPGGSDTTYAYPTDPINSSDLNGHWWGWLKSAAHAVGRGLSVVGHGLSIAGHWAWQHKWELATGALAVGCVFMTPLGCMAAGGVLLAAQTGNEYRRTHRVNWANFAFNAALTVGGGLLGRALGGGWRGRNVRQGKGPTRYRTSGRTLRRLHVHWGRTGRNFGYNAVNSGIALSAGQMWNGRNRHAW